MEAEKKSIDPGWNDPPIFSYTESQSLIKTPKRNLLNKRVAYPLSNDSTKNDSSATSVPHFNFGLPPPTALEPSITTSSTISSEPVATIAEDRDDPVENLTAMRTDPTISENTLLQVLANVDQVIEVRNQLLQNQNKLEQVKKKIRTLEESWRSKLPDDVKERVLKLSAAMKEQNRNEANEIQVSLMVDHPKLCSDFISAFRMLINIE